MMDPADAVPLYSWWSETLHDHYTTTDPDWNGNGLVAGTVNPKAPDYRFLQLEGYLPRKGSLTKGFVRCGLPAPPTEMDVAPEGCSCSLARRGAGPIGLAPLCLLLCRPRRLR